MEALSLLFSAIFVGALLPVQAGLNMQLAKTLGHPMWGALISFCVGTACIMAFALFSGMKTPTFSSLSATPPWIWCGGILGAIFVAGAIVISPRLGATTTVALFIAGQMLMSLLLDHQGAVGFSVHPINVWRIAGALLVVGGVALIRVF